MSGVVRLLFFIWLIHLTMTPQFVGRWLAKVDAVYHAEKVAPSAWPPRGDGK